MSCNEILFWSVEAVVEINLKKKSELRKQIEKIIRI